MPSQTIIRRVSSLKGLGVFRDYSASADVPDFKRHNLIYGFNGSGKTILSRVFACLETGTVNSELPPGGQFEIELTDGTIVSNDNALDVLKSRLLVFNDDFIEENLRWAEGAAKSIFYIGREQLELATELGEKEATLTALRQERADAGKGHVRSENAFTEHKRNAARLIAEQLGLGRRYDATDLVADYERASHGQELELAEKQRHHLRAAINQESPLDKRDLLDTTSFDFVTLMRDVRSILETTLGSMVLSDLRHHDRMLKWVKEGVDYHQEHDLSSCLFCGNILTDERMDALQQAIDDKFERLTRDITAATDRAKQLRDRLASITSTVPSVNDISRDQQIRFMLVADALKETLGDGHKYVASAIALLETKAKTPNVRVEADELTTESYATQWNLSATRKLSELNRLIDEHNTAHDKFDQTQDTARKKLREHFLAVGQTAYHQLDVETTAANRTVDVVEIRYQSLTREADVIRQQISKHGPAAERISRMIHGYLGHKELEFVALESGYEIRRNGMPVTGSLSEGEKTAIALCYFLSTLEAEGRKTKNLIVVIDDPISSLDTKALHYAYSMLKGKLDAASQLIVLTHNLQFMNEVKKWLKPKQKKGTAALFFLDALMEDGADTRSTIIREMPKLIRDYESEYHYLFHLALEFAASPVVKSDHAYLMPNALRKVLEIFLAFKLPGPDGLANKVENVAGGGYGVDPASIRALNRLVQLESHADNLDDLVTLSAMTIEESKGATDALFAMMETLDKDHYERMKKICS